jgi:O-6-methylguanine DNA methyltransferase
MKKEFDDVSAGTITLKTPVGSFDITIAVGEVQVFGWEAPSVPGREPVGMSGDAKRFVEELEEYFRSGAWDFSWFRLPVGLVPGKTMRVYEYLRKKVGPGSVVTYRELGRVTGTHPRGIGSMMRSNPWPIVVPCHRVIGSDGSLVGYAGGLEKKEWLLKLEGWPGGRK